MLILMRGVLLLYLRLLLQIISTIQKEIVKLVLYLALMNLIIVLKFLKFHLITFVLLHRLLHHFHLFEL